MIRLKMDTKAFSSGMLQAAGTVQASSVKGMEEAMSRFLSDVLDKSPSCPIDTKNLYDSHETDVRREGANVTGTLSVSGVSYAAPVHEGVTSRGVITKWTRPGSGPNWIGSKALMYSESYFGRAALNIFGSIRRLFRWRR